MAKANLALCVLALLVCGISGCGSSDSTSGAPASGKGEGGSSKSGSTSQKKELTAIASNAEPEGGIVGVLSISRVENLGPILIDRGHHVVYVFQKDRGSTSSCYGVCAANWPPMLTESNPLVRDGIDPKRVTTTERKDGELQVTYDGMPLYGFSGDENPYEASGDGVKAFGGKWYALKPNGESLETR